MGTGFHDAAIVQNGDLIGVANGGDPVRNENGSSSLHDFAQVIQNLIFGMRVHAGERVVENQNFRIANQSPGNRGALFLSAG